MTLRFVPILWTRRKQTEAKQCAQSHPRGCGLGLRSRPSGWSTRPFSGLCLLFGEMRSVLIRSGECGLPHTPTPTPSLTPWHVREDGHLSNIFLLSGEKASHWSPLPLPCTDGLLQAGLWLRQNHDAGCVLQANGQSPRSSAPTAACDVNSSTAVIHLFPELSPLCSETQAPPR